MYRKAFNRCVGKPFSLKDADSITWVNLNGLNHVKEIEKLW